MPSATSNFSQELAAAAERIGPSVVTVHARHRMPSSGFHWRQGVIVTANHAVRREEDVTILWNEGGIGGPSEQKRSTAKLVGRDPGTDLAVLKLDGQVDAPVANLGAAANLKLANFVLALGRTRRGTLVASAGIIGGLGGEWRTWRGGRVDQSIRLDLELYPGFSGGPLVSVEGEVLGINTSGLARGRAITIPVATVNRSVDELLAKGHIARPYLGIAMQPVAISEALRSKLNSTAHSGLMVMHVEPAGPAEKAGVLLGDIIVEVNGKPVLDTDHVQHLLASAQVGQSLNAVVGRAGAPVSVTVVLGERAAQ